jgi:hypothetical protein
MGGTRIDRAGGGYVRTHDMPDARAITLVADGTSILSPFVAHPSRFAAPAEAGPNERAACA